MKRRERAKGSRCFRVFEGIIGGKVEPDLISIFGKIEELGKNNRMWAVEYSPRGEFLKFEKLAWN